MGMKRLQHNSYTLPPNFNISNGHDDDDDDNNNNNKFTKLVWIRDQLDVTLCYPLFLLYNLLNMFRTTMCLSSGADDCVVLSHVLALCRGCRKAVRTG